MTLKQQKFADEFMISRNATEAAIKAGYSKKSAYASGAENLRKPVIIEYISKRRKQIESKKIAEQKEIFEYLSSVMRGEITDVALIDGEVVDVPTTIKNRTLAAKELLRRNFIVVHSTATTDGEAWAVACNMKRGINTSQTYANLNIDDKTFIKLEH